MDLYCNWNLSKQVDNNVTLWCLETQKLFYGDKTFKLINIHEFDKVFDQSGY